MALQTQATQTETGKKKVYEPVPSGEYLVKFDRIAETATKKADGTYMKSSFSIQNGDYERRLVFHNFFHNLQSQDANKIGRQQIDKLLKAMGVPNGFGGIGNDVTLLEGFLGKELIVEVGVKPAANGFKAQNYIKKWRRS